MTELIGIAARQRSGCNTLNCSAASTMDITLPLDFKEFLRLLNEKSVEYLLIGGYAVNIISLRHLRINKRASGRHKDLNDLDNLPG